MERCYSVFSGVPHPDSAIIIVYFILFIFYTIITTMMHERVQHLRSLVKIKVKLWKIWRRNTRKVKGSKFNMNNLTNEIPDLAFKYIEFQEPLVCCD